MARYFNIMLAVCLWYYVPAMHAELADKQSHVFAIPRTWPTNSYPPRVLITTSSLNPVLTTLSIPGLGFEVDTTITRYNNADIALPIAARITEAGLYDDKAIIVISSYAVNIHAFDNDHLESDGFSVLENSQLGMEYIIPGYLPYRSYHPSFFTITALDNETSIDFVTKAGNVQSINLDHFQTFLFNGGNFEDLSGTHITSNKHISVTSGMYTRIPQWLNHQDGLLVNVPPVETWGQRFVLAPILTKSCGYIYRVISGNQTTTLSISNIGTMELQGGGNYYEADVATETMVTIQSNYPVLVAKYMKGRDACDNRGDPAMIVVSPLYSYYNNVTFPVFEITHSSPKRYSINVITNCSDADSLVFDDTTSMSKWAKLTTEDESMCCIRGEVTPGVHSVINTNPLAAFTVSVYMMSTGASSYAYQAAFIYTVPFMPSTEVPLTTDLSPVSTIDVPIMQSTEVPPTTDLSPISTIDGLNLLCEGTNMSAIFNTSLLPFEHVNDVHMSDENCTALAYSDNMAIITTDYNKCNTVMEESEDHIIFRNALILRPNDPSSPIKPPQVEIECRIERRHMLDTSFHATLKRHVSFGNFSFELQIYHDSTYSAPYEPEEFPIVVKLGDDLFLSASVTTVNALEIFVDSCWGTPSINPWDDTRYSVISSGCPDDNSLTFVESGEDSTQRFSLAAFAFKGDTWLVFLHCAVVVCDSISPNSICKADCNDQTSRVRRSNEDMHTVSSGPLVVRG